MVEAAAAAAASVLVAAGLAVAVESVGVRVEEKDEEEEEDDEVVVDDDDDDKDDEEEEEELVVVVDAAEDVLVRLLELALVLSADKPAWVVVVSVNVNETLTVGRVRIIPLALLTTVAAWLLAVPHPHCENPPSNIFR